MSEPTPDTKHDPSVVKIRMAIVAHIKARLAEQAQQRGKSFGKTRQTQAAIDMLCGAAVTLHETDHPAYQSLMFTAMMVSVRGLEELS